MPRSDKQLFFGFFVEGHPRACGRTSPRATEGVARCWAGQVLKRAIVHGAIVKAAAWRRRFRKPCLNILQNILPMAGLAKFVLCFILLAADAIASAASAKVEAIKIKQGIAMSSEQLTPREKEILKLVARGMTNKEIAKEFGSSPYTVRNQLNALYKKVGAANRIALALAAMKAIQRVAEPELKPADMPFV